MSGNAAIEPSWVAGMMAARRRIGIYPTAYCTACPASCAATPMDATEVELYTAFDRRMVLVRGSKWSVSLPATHSTRTPVTPFCRSTASAACAPVRPRRLSTRS